MVRLEAVRGQTDAKTDYPVSMLTLSLDGRKPSPLRVLCLGAHADDIEIGCGGTILKLLEEYSHVAVDWVVFSGTRKRELEARRSAKRFLEQARFSRVVVKHFQDAYFPYHGRQIKSFVQELAGRLSPDLIFTHRSDDLHQDHRLVSELTWNAFRNHLILEYEVPKYDGDMSSPNFLVPLKKTICARKIEHLLHSFRTQKDKAWFVEDTFWAILRLRGIESRSFSAYAEGFHCRKLVLS